MLELTLSNVDFGVGDLHPQGADLPAGKVIRLEDPITRMVVNIPLAPEAAEMLAKALRGEPVVPVIRAMPPLPKDHLAANGMRR